MWSHQTLLECFRHRVPRVLDRARNHGWEIDDVYHGKVILRLEDWLPSITVDILGWILHVKDLFLHIKEFSRHALASRCITRLKYGSTPPRLGE
jgi:hypothetical protein